MERRDMYLQCNVPAHMNVFPAGGPGERIPVAIRDGAVISFMLCLQAAGSMVTMRMPL